MRKRKSKIPRLLFMCAAIICLLLNGAEMIHAESVSFETDSFTYFLQNDLLNEGWVIHDGIFMVEGTPAYCIEPKETIVIGEDRYETGDWETYQGYSDAVKQKIAEYACFGYGSPGFTDMESWYAAQILVWQVINSAYGDTRVYKDPSYDGSRFMSGDAYEITDTVRERMRAIQQRIDRSHIRVNAVCHDENGNTVSLPAQIEAGQTLTVHDEAGALAYYTLQNPQEGVTHNGNDLIIDSSHLSSLTLRFRYGGMEDSLLSAPLVLKSRDGSKIQTLIIRGCCELDDFTLTLKIKDAKLRMRKTDSMYGNDPVNGAELKGAEYELFNETLHESCGHFVTDVNGVSDIIAGLNNADTYSLKETKAPKGYTKDQQTHTFRLRDLIETDGVYEISLSDEVIQAPAAIHKVIANKDSSDLARNEKGAHFAILSTRALDHYGSFEKAMEHYDEIHENEKSIIITDENGYGQSGMLAYGQYTARQIKASDENLQLCEDFRFSIDESRTEPIVFEVSNIPSRYRLRIIKKDADDGMPITFTSAAFQILDQSGNPVVQKVGSASCDTFMSASENPGKHGKNVFIDTSSKEGELVLPLPLDAGKYGLVEVNAPKGYRSSSSVIPFEITGTALSEGDLPCVEVIVENEQIKGSLTIHKQVRVNECDHDLFDHDDLSGITFTLYAKDDIVSCKDGKLLYAKGQAVKTAKTDQAGNASMDDIPCGLYVLKETDTAAGLILSEKEEEILINEERTSYTFDFVNEETRTVFSKKAASQSEELPGAHLTVREEDGTLIDEWISGKEPHVILGLDPLKTYIMREEISPGLTEGDHSAYVKAEEISFTPSADPQGSTVTMTDTLVRAVKYDENGKPLPGAHLCVRDQNNEIVDEWISGENDHVIHHLKAGEVYTLSELEAPQGYYLSYDISFIVNGLMDQRIIMDDAPIRLNVRKIEEGSGKDLPGVTLKLYEVNEDSESIVLEWVTQLEPREIGTYLKAGTMYRLEEAESVNGVYPAADMYFETDLYDPLDDTPLMITMIDASVALAAVKTDVNGRYLSGAHMNLCDEEGNVLYEWISGSSPEDLSPYVKGNGTYVLSETQSPQGYALVDPLRFTVNGNTGKNQVIRAVDRNVRLHLTVRKTDSETGEVLKDCEVTVFRSADDSVAYDVTGNKAKLRTDETGEAHITLPYEPEGYYVLETKAPKGYTLNRSRFDISAKRENNPAAVFEKVEISDQKKSVNTGVDHSGGWLFINAGIILALCALIAQCVFQSESRR